MGRKSTRSKAKKNYKDMNDGKLPEDDRSKDTESISSDELTKLDQEERELDIQLKKVRIDMKRKELEQLQGGQLPANSQENLPNVSGAQAMGTQAGLIQKDGSANLKSLSQDKELNAAMELLQSAPLQDILENSTDSTASKGKWLHIIDFVSTPKSTSKQADKRLFRDIYQKGTKIKLEEISISQWLSANAKIMLELLDSLSPEEVRDYLKYTAKVGDYLQKGDPISVFLLDKEHRKMVATEGQRCATTCNYGYVTALI